MAGAVVRRTHWGSIELVYGSAVSGSWLGSVGSAIAAVASNCDMINAAVLVKPAARAMSIDGTNADVGGANPPMIQGSTINTTTAAVLVH